MKYKNLLQIPLLLLSMSTFTLATVYKSGDRDSGEIEWKVYDNKPSGAKIILGGYDAFFSTYTAFKGKGRSNAYMLGAKSAKSELNWNNTKEFVCAWDMQIEEKYRITIYATTEKGSRRFVFTHKKRDKGLYRKKYIGIGLSKKSISKKWQHIEADLAEKLDKYEPDNKLISINGIQVRGSGSFDNIELKSHLGYTDQIKRYCQDIDKDYDEPAYCDTEKQLAYYTTFSSAPEFGTYLYTIDLNTGHTLRKTLVSTQTIMQPVIKAFSEGTLIAHYDYKGYDQNLLFYFSQNQGELQKILTLQTSNIISIESAEEKSKLLVRYSNKGTDYKQTYDISKLPIMTLLSTEEE